MTNRLFAVTFDCAGAAGLGGFWAQALGQELDPGAGKAFASIGLHDSGRAEPRWCFAQVPEVKSAKNRMHPDLITGGSRCRGGAADRPRCEMEGGYRDGQHALDHSPGSGRQRIRRDRRGRVTARDHGKPSASQGCQPGNRLLKQDSLTGGNYQSLSARTGPGLVLADAPGPLVQYTERGRAMNEPIERKQTMTSAVNLFFAAVNIGCADPAGLADFWAGSLAASMR